MRVARTLTSVITLSLVVLPVGESSATGSAATGSIAFTSMGERGAFPYGQPRRNRIATDRLECQLAALVARAKPARIHQALPRQYGL